MFRFFRTLPFLFLLTSLAHSDVVSTQTVTTVQSVGAGCRVDYIRPKSPAEKAGFQVGDYIVGVDSYPVQDIDTLKEAIARAGAQAQVDFLHADQTRRVMVDLLPPGGTESRFGVSCTEVQMKSDIPCPFPVQTGTRVHLELKDGRSFNGKLEKCGGEIGLRTGIMYRTFDASQVSNMTPR